ncbi:MAG TPA: Uma2 family endonuclease [Candidatus Binatia bacterium]|nr:Uma2 family endonuclease [Candidatus Binatia bacterium]
MATTTAAPVTVEEYLRTSYEPDVEYVDGQLEERNVGEIDHSKVIARIMKWFMQHEQKWEILVLPDVRTQTGPSRFRVPDIVISRRASQDKRIVREAPLVIIEVLSPEDRISRYHQRIADYRAMGVRAIWVVDPETRRGWDCSSGNWIETADFHLPPLSMNLASIFAEIES